jgi:hypothetical protein
VADIVDINTREVRHQMPHERDTFLACTNCGGAWFSFPCLIEKLEHGWQVTGTAEEGSCEQCGQTLVFPTNQMQLTPL